MSIRRTNVRSGFLVLGLLGLAAVAQAKVVYVAKTGNDANDGLSWAKARRTVQAGLNMAQINDQVWVAAGTYVERVTLMAGAALYGGFSGNETSLSQRNWRANRTILDGNAGGSVVTSPSGQIPAARIDGFTIRNGHAEYGGGIYCVSSSPTITNNTIAGNSATQGAGIFCDRSSPMIANNTIMTNSAAYIGGGICCHILSSPTIANNTITGNGAQSNGGGISCFGASPRIANTIIAFNSSGVYREGGAPSLGSNCVYGNTGYNYLGLTDPTGINGSISVDPGLAGIPYGNVHIQPDSPCVDAGDDSAVQGGWYDMDGQPRLTGSHVDIGADESDGTVWPEGPYVIVRVSPEGNDANDGLSWASAKRTVQAAIDEASALGGEVWVKTGIYLERIALPAYVYLYGGFGGSEMERDQRDWCTYVCILDGQAGGSVVVTSRTNCTLSTIDGFTIRNGKTAKGGGIFCNRSSPTIANCTITGNDGGGIYCNSCSPSIANSTIAGNIGSGLFCDYSSPTIASSAITGNSASEGGGVYCYNSSPTLANSTIAGNIASSNGGGICGLSSSAKITNSTITGNGALTGGGVYCLGGSPELTNSTITGNSASSSGGGIYCSSASPTIANDTIIENIASQGGGIYCSDSSSPTITNTIIAFNSSGVHCNGGSPSLRSNCVYGNGGYNYSALTDPTGSNGNISVDPRLAAALYGNMHIQPDSPCLDAGDDSVVQSNWRDLDGQARIVGPHVDIGADESDSTAWHEGPSVIVRVRPEGNDANDGSSWTSAKRTVQAAIETSSALGGEVWVKAGTYLERITLRPYVHVYGGFGGTETECQQRDWRARVCILDGQAAGSVVTVNQCGGLPNTIDGFTIRNGTGTLPSSSRYGGGIYCQSSSPTIMNNKITGNGAYAGGGIWCNYSNPVIHGNTITGNTASNSGGGICCNASSPTIANNTIAGNLAQNGAGGGVSCYFFSSPHITNNLIVGNIASKGGGLDCSNASSPIGANNTITGNFAYTGSGGGIRCSDSSSPIIANTIIAFNSSGVYRSGGTPSLRSNCVYGNTVYNYSGLTDPTGTSGNISVDPGFAGVLYGNTHIQPNSPCVDAGDDSMAENNWKDIDGQPRIGGSRVDIGADESDGTSWPGGGNVVVRVRPDGNDANDGSSWISAKRTVQAAINTASATGGDVWVGTGTYLEQITLRSYVHVYGGFGGTETQREERDWLARVSILDGQAKASVVTANQAGHLLSTVDGLTLRNGKAASGAGVYCDYSSPAIRNNTIIANAAVTGSGGGICSNYSSPVIENNTITANSASSAGGGIYCKYSCPTITKNTITGNGSRLGGGLTFSYSSPPVTNNIVMGNWGTTYGGGIHCSGSSPTMVNNTITGNSAPSGGGAIYCDTSSSPTMANTIIAFNSSGVYSGGGKPFLRFNCVYGNPGYNFSGVTNPTGSNGNISVDPGFVRTPSPGVDGQWATADDDTGDLRLKAGSPCIDAGDNGAVPAGILTDLGGLPRFFNDPATVDTGLGTAPIVDIGAYEYIPGDFDRDGDIDPDDLTIFTACVSGPAVPYTGDCAKADFDKDGDADQSDFGLLQRCFSGTGKPVDPACAN